MHVEPTGKEGVASINRIPPAIRDTIEVPETTALTTDLAHYYFHVETPNASPASPLSYSPELALDVNEAASNHDLVAPLPSVQCISEQNRR
jgi:hypothetical protein